MRFHLTIDHTALIQISYMQPGCVTDCVIVNDRLSVADGDTAPDHRSPFHAWQTV